MRKVIIMRGPSGSGKSTFVKEVFPDAVVCSADHFFEGHCPETGFPTYEFDPSKIGMAHADCMRKFMSLLFSLYSEEAQIVVDNCNTQLWELANYAYLARKLGWTVEIYTTMPTAFTVEELTLRNKHGVPSEVIERMVSTYQAHVEERRISLKWRGSSEYRSA